MCSRVELVGTTFVDVGGEKTYGFRMFDDYESVYYNLSDELITDDLQLLRFVNEIDSAEFSGLLDAAAVSGCRINGRWYDSEEVKLAFSSANLKDTPSPAADVSEHTVEAQSNSDVVTGRVDAWKEACLYIYAAIRRDSGQGQPINLMSHTDVQEIVRLVVKAEML